MIAPAKRDETVPNGQWAFDEAVTDVFDDMLARSIPQYEEMRSLCTKLAIAFRRPKADFVDLGCSRGAAMAPLVDEFGATNRYTGVEVSKPMVEAARQRFAGFPGIVSIKEMDLRHAYPAVDSCVTLAVLTLQFVPIEYRQNIIQRVYDSLQQGGAFILVEKVLGASAVLDDSFVSLYLEMKREHGYTKEQIDRKRLSLEGVLVPVTAAMNEDFLRLAGFSKVDTFWRWLNFAGWVAVK